MSGDGLTRRDALRLVLLGGGALLSLAGCADDTQTLTGPHTDEVLRTSIAIDYASYYAPATDIIRLAKARAAERKLALTFSADPSGAGAQVASLKRLTGARGGFRVVVVAPFDAAAVDGVVRDAIDREIKVVSFVSPLEHATAAVAVDARDAASRLVAHAARHGAGGRVILVAPPATSPIPDPFFGHAVAAARALTTELAARGVEVAATVTAIGTPDATEAIRAARSAHRDTRAVLTWNDTTALGAAAAVPHDGYVGALGAPTVSTAAALHALDADGPLRCLVAARVSDLATALVDVPAALLKGSPIPAAAHVPVTTFTRGAAATRAALGDYAP